MRIAFVNMVGYRNYPWQRRSFSEPVHLLGMHGICRQHGHASNIFQFGYPSSERSVRAIRKFKPDVLGLSFVGRDQESISGAHEILRSFDGRRPRLMIGGTDVRYYTDYYVDQFSPYHPREARPPGFLVALGAGEHLMSALAPFGFNAFNDEAFRRIDGFTVTKEGAVVIGDLPPVPLDEQGFERPYQDFFPYRYRANVKWAEGCWAKCSFCSNEPAAVRYASPERAVREVNYLEYSWGVNDFSVTAPNFTAHPDSSSEIIAALPWREKRYLFNSRIDSLYFAIQRHPGVWRGFGREWNRIDLGVESFIPERLGPERLGKYSNLGKAQLQEERLRQILDFFKGSRLLITFYLIPFDWKMSLEELATEIERYRFYAAAYPLSVFLPLSYLGNMLRFEPGSSFSSNMTPADFYNFERDPRALLLAMLIRERIRQLQPPEGSTSLFEQLTFMRLPGYLSICLQKAREIAVDHFKIGPILEIVRGGGTEKALLEEFCAQLGERREEFQGYFDAQFWAAFPGLAEPHPPSGLTDRFWRWLGG